MADRAAAWLRLKSAAERREILIAALRDTSSSTQGLPEQASSLVKGSWPLIITTNYDDILPVANEREPGALPLRVLGRSAQDCAQVIRGLDVIQDLTVWYIQGHVAGVAASVRQPCPRLEALLDEVVIGHQQYQGVINSATAFRRAFSEVFRRRSLLFVGSGLAESYFVNLIAETLFALGPSPSVHYALFSRADLEKVDPEFLAVRLGITPVVYGDTHRELPGALSRIAVSRDNPVAAQSSGAMLSRLSFEVPRGDHAGECQDRVEVTIRFAGLSAPRPHACVALSVGLDRIDDRIEPGYGQMAWRFFIENRKLYDDPEAWFSVPQAQSGRLFRLGTEDSPHPVFLVGAREGRHSENSDERSLAAITEATREALAAIEEAGFEKVSMGVFSAGEGQEHDVAYCLIAQLSGVRTFLDSSSGSRMLHHIEICVFDGRIWAPVIEGRINVGDLLTSRLARVLVRVADRQGRWDEYALSVAHGSTVGDVLQSYKITGEDADVSARPLTRGLTSTIYDAPVFPGMIIEVQPLISSPTDCSLPPNAPAAQAASREKNDIPARN
ncbi:SIR2 family NAD-dependent protein deacylase [Microvirga splendida]|uniref:SIR2 family NAD-dependent protein deacylase n=1 Tax=Microvirga splendida TaxID=2795727 RepID=UPI001AEDF3F9|nr:SIR2 family protein [Microvirga splendida]